MGQTVLSGYKSYKNLAEILHDVSCRKFLLVCDSAFKFLNIQDTIDGIDIPYEVFSEFTPNPLYEDVKTGVAKFKKAGCDAIVAVGGGSTIDVAKCIKLFSAMRGDDYLSQPFCDSGVPFIAIPTTAGTGSEATHFAVMYSDGRKLSIAHESLIPNYVILDYSLLKTLPLYQKKCTMLDALCHGIEAWWSKNSTDESKEYSKIAIRKIIENKDGYLNGNEYAAEQILIASNFAGKAINIAKTTAAHAMSYKLTSMYGIPHGHAVAICLPSVWKFMCSNLDKCNDKRGKNYLIDIFTDIANTLGESNAEGGIRQFEIMLKQLQIEAPHISEQDINILVASVNTERLNNNPVIMDKITLSHIYRNIVEF